MKTRKVLIVLLCVILCVLMFTACESPETTGGVEPTPIPSATAESEEAKIAMKAGDVYRAFVWNNYEENQFVDGTSLGVRAEDYRQRWLDFQQQYDVTITWVANPNPSNWMDAVLSPAAAGNPLADIYHMGGPFAITSSLGYGGTAFGSLYEDLSRYSEYTNFDDNRYWDVNAIESVGWYSGKNYIVVPHEEGFASISLNQVTFFNKAIVSAAGYSPEIIYEWYKNGEWTFEKFSEVALACADPDKELYGYPITQNGFVISALIAANGGAILTPDEKGIPKFTADSNESLYAINYFLDECKKPNVVCMLDNGMSQNESKLFANGTVGLMVTYANRVVEIYENQDLDYGVVLPPKGPNATDYISEKNWFSPYSVFKGHENPAGVVQCLSLYLCAAVPMDSVEQTMLLEGEIQSYFRDKESIQSIKDSADKSQTTSYMAYWDLSEGGLGFGTIAIYNAQKWITGESTPEIDYAATKEIANKMISDLFKDKK